MVASGKRSERGKSIRWCGAFSYIILSSCLIAISLGMMFEARAFSFRCFHGARWNERRATYHSLTCCHFSFIGCFLKLSDVFSGDVIADEIYRNCSQFSVASDYNGMLWTFAQIADWWSWLSWCRIWNVLLFLEIN